MHKLALAAAMCGLLEVGAAAAQEVQAAAQERYEALMKKYTDARKSWMERYRSAKSNEERLKIRGEQPKPAEFTPGFWEVVKAGPQAPVAAKALLFICQTETDAAKQDKAFDLMLEHHADGPEAKLAARFVNKYRISNGGIRLLDHLGTNAESAEEKAQYMFNLAGVLAAASGYAQQFSGPAGKACIDYYGKFMGMERCQQLAKLDAGMYGKKAEAIYETLLKDHADVSLARRGKVGDMAKRALFELRNLSIGKMAPEIEAEDIEGVEFKLSDYRGKVVMLDFWGDW